MRSISPSASKSPGSAQTVLPMLSMSTVLSPVRGLIMTIRPSFSFDGCRIPISATIHWPCPSISAWDTRTGAELCESFDKLYVSHWQFCNCRQSLPAGAVLNRPRKGSVKVSSTWLPTSSVRTFATTGCSTSLVIRGVILIGGSSSFSSVEIWLATNSIEMTRNTVPEFQLLEGLLLGME